MHTLVFPRVLHLTIKTCRVIYLKIYVQNDACMKTLKEMTEKLHKMLKGATCQVIKTFRGYVGKYGIQWVQRKILIIYVHNIYRFCMRYGANVNIASSILHCISATFSLFIAFIVTSTLPGFAGSEDVASDNTGCGWKRRLPRLRPSPPGKLMWGLLTLQWSLTEILLPALTCQ